MKKGAKLLVVDDDEGHQSGLYDLLCLYGFDVSTAANGIEALMLMEEDTPDLILSDILMPEMDGEQFYARVRSRDEWHGIPFIFLTAKEDVWDERYGPAPGAEGFIRKPFEPEDLAEIVLRKLVYYEEEMAEVSSDPIREEPDGVPEAIANLTTKEREVLKLIARGVGNADIAEQLAMRVAAVKTHVAHILAKLGVGSRVEAATYALEIGLDCLDD